MARSQNPVGGDEAAATGVVEDAILLILQGDLEAKEQRAWVVRAPQFGSPAVILWIVRRTTLEGAVHTERNVPCMTYTTAQGGPVTFPLGLDSDFAKLYVPRLCFLSGNPNML